MKQSGGHRVLSAHDAEEFADKVEKQFNFEIAYKNLQEQKMV